VRYLRHANQGKNVMLKNRGIVILAITAVFVLNGCVAPPPREQVVYHEGSEDQNGPGRYCHLCGTVRDIDQIELHPGNTGGGAVLGAIIGGLIGSQFGHGSGQAAATAAGVIAGSAVGNAAEEDNARHAAGYAWRFRVELDDGRWATVTQTENPGFRPGARVYVQRDHLEAMRQ
jgi:outer membrane lipoprotein SlyB